MPTTILGKVAMIPRGTWAAGTYNKNEYVYYEPDNATYCSLKDGNTVTPSNDGVNWFLLCRGVGTISDNNYSDADKALVQSAIQPTQKNVANGYVGIGSDGTIDNVEFLLVKNREVNVKDYGAKGDGTTDDTTAIQAAINALGTNGGTLHFPQGVYVISSTLTIDLTYNSTGLSGKSISIAGDGENTTVLLNTATTNIYTLVVQTTNTTGATAKQYFNIRSISFKGTAQNSGLNLNTISYCSLSNVVFYGFNLATNLQDVCGCRFVECMWDANANAIQGNAEINFTSPNAIEFFGCYIYGNGETAVYFTEACNINFYGGTIETNGFNRGTSNTCGIRFFNCGKYGGSICNFYGTYFEGNTNCADIWITTKNYPGTYNIIGCTFNKFASPKDNTNNIYIETNLNTIVSQVNVIGCAFLDKGNTPSSSTPYIKNYATTNVLVKTQGNYYQTQIEIPNLGEAEMFATGRFTSMSTTPALYTGYNISSITRNSIGDYTITFITPSQSAQRVYTTNIQNGNCYITNETTTTVEMVCKDFTGALFDPSYLMLTAY